VGGAEHDQPVDQPGVQRGRGPADEPARPRADDGGAALAEGADQAGDVGGEGEPVVAAGWLVAGAVAAQVGGDSAVAGIGEQGQLVVPRTRGSRAAAV
jgi:hypothetical protein